MISSLKGERTPVAGDGTNDAPFPWLNNAELRSEIYGIWATTCDFQQCGILTWTDSDEHAQPPVKLRNSKCCSAGSWTVIQYSSNKQRLWSDCAYAQAGLSLCWSHIPHCWKSHVAAHLFVWFDSLPPINNLSVMQGQVILGWTSTKLGLMYRSRTQHSDTIEALTSSPSVSSQALYHWAIAILKYMV